MDESLNPENRSDRKCPGGLDLDRISKLPDSLLHHILSFVSTRDTVRTSLLSRRWQNLWVLVPYLDLYTQSFSDKNDVYNFIDRFLHLRGNSPLQKFKVDYDFPERPTSRLKSWIDAAITCKVEHLDVGIFFVDELSEDRIEASQSLFICNTLVVLKLKDAIFLDVPKKVSLSNLKIMHLESVIYANDFAFKSLISGCPLLEELRIHRPYEDNVKVMCVCSHTLKQLLIWVSNFDDSKEYEIVIDAPNLEELFLEDEQTERFTITNIGSASLKVGLSVQFHRDLLDVLEDNDFSMRSNICKLLNGISNARSLKLSLNTFELFCQYRKFETLPQFHNLIQMEAELSQSAFKVLPGILECCPNLKILALELGDNDDSDIHPLRFSPAAPQRTLSSLVSVTLQTPFIGDAMELNLIKYFLRKSPVLKEIKMYLLKHPNLEDEFLILKKILTFRRRSTACRVYIKQARFNFS